MGSSVQHIAGYWSDLKSQVDTSPLRLEAMQLLADWREVLRQRALEPRQRKPPWMRALEALLAGTAHTDRRILYEDARLVGPVQLAVPARTGSNGGDTAELLLYLPVLAKGFSTRFSELLFFSPRSTSARPARWPWWTLSGARSRRFPSRRATWRRAWSCCPAWGQIREAAGVARVHGSAYSVEDQANAPGYRKLVFEPLLAAAARSHRRVRFEEVDVQAFPTLFPDAVRLLVSQPGADHPDGARIQSSRAVTSRLKPGCARRRRGCGSPCGTRRARRPGSWPCRWPTGSRAGLVERFGPADATVDVGEIRALGLRCGSISWAKRSCAATG